MLRIKDRKRPLIGHININSIRYKFQEIRDLFDRNLVDLFCVSETKIDNTFSDQLFSVDGYKLYRNDDRDARGVVL
jgi:exonuclease III